MIFPRGKHGSLHLFLFRQHQIDQATEAKSSNYFECSLTSDIESENDTTIGKSFLNHPKLDSHTIRMFLQHHRARIVFLCSLPQSWQAGSSRTFRLAKLDRVGSASRHARIFLFYLVHSSSKAVSRRAFYLSYLIPKPSPVAPFHIAIHILFLQSIHRPYVLAKSNSQLGE